MSRPRAASGGFSGAGDRFRRRLDRLAREAEARPDARPTPEQLSALREALDELRLSRRLNAAIDAQAILAWRRQLGLTQETLALRLGVSPQTVRQWEQARRRISEPAARLFTLIWLFTTQ